MKLFSSLKNQATSYLDDYKQKSPASYAAAQQAIGGVLIADGIFGLDNPLGNKKRSGIFGSLGGVVLGVVFMFIPTIFGSLSGTNKMTATTSATVVSVGAASATQNSGTSFSTNSSSSSNSNSSSSSSCPLTVRYTVDGQEYTKQSSISSSSNCSLSVGQNITINYNPSNPASWANDVKTIGLFMSIFFWVGLLVVLTSLVTFVMRLLSIIFGWKILQSGRKLAATLPEGTNLQTIVDEVKKHFIGSVFNFGGVATGISASSSSISAKVPTPTTKESKQP